MINLDTYIISDTHFGHENIIKYCDRPKDHDLIMYMNWIATIRNKSNILHLGDVMWYKNDTPWEDGKTLQEMVRSLPGKKFLIKGNHDKKSNEWWEGIGFEIMPQRTFFKHNDQIILFTHYPEDRLDIEWNVNIHGHIHNNSYAILQRDGRTWINVSIEMMDYMPVKLRDILDLRGKVV